VARTARLIAVTMLCSAVVALTGFVTGRGAAGLGRQMFLTPIGRQAILTA
jgi:hypothetical protein